MPEGHTIHRLARAMNAAFGNTRVRLSSPQGRFEAGATELDGWVMARAEAAGKHLFMGFAPHEDTEPLRFIHIHLGLYGSWTFAGSERFHQVRAIGAPRKGLEVTSDGSWASIVPGVNVRLRIRGAEGLADLTGPNQCRVIDEAEREAVLERLGPDPLRSDADPREFVRRIKKSRQSIGQLLMDQRVCAGIGNIYRAELLFRARLDPYVPGNELTTPLIERCGRISCLSWRTASGRAASSRRSPSIGRFTASSTNARFPCTKTGMMTPRVFLARSRFTCITVRGSRAACARRAFAMPTLPGAPCTGVPAAKGAAFARPGGRT